MPWCSARPGTIAVLVLRVRHGQRAAAGDHAGGPGRALAEAQVAVAALVIVGEQRLGGAGAVLRHLQHADLVGVEQRADGGLRARHGCRRGKPRWRPRERGGSADGFRQPWCPMQFAVVLPSRYGSGPVNRQTSRKLERVSAGAGILGAERLAGLGVGRVPAALALAGRAPRFRRPRCPRARSPAGSRVPASPAPASVGLLARPRRASTSGWRSRTRRERGRVAGHGQLDRVARGLLVGDGGAAAAGYEGEHDDSNGESHATSSQRGNAAIRRPQVGQSFRSFWAG